MERSTLPVLQRIHNITDIRVHIYIYISMIRHNNYNNNRTSSHRSIEMLSFWLSIMVFLCHNEITMCTEAVNNDVNSHNNNRWSRSRSRLFEMDDVDHNKRGISGGRGGSSFDWNGSGREWDVFTYRPPRGGDNGHDDENKDSEMDDNSSSSNNVGDSRNIFNSSFDLDPTKRSSSRSSTYYPNNRRKRRKRSGTRTGGRARSNSSSSTNKDIRNEKDEGSNQGFKDWLLGGGLPKVQIRAEPQTIIKVRKTLRPLKTILTLGADFNMGLGIWQFKSGWEDPILGGRLTLAGRELQLSKTWLLSVGVVEDLVTRLRLKAAVDLSTRRAYARLGFRTERLSPINVVEGFTGKWMIPLDRPDNKVKLEIKANFAFPEPEIEYSTESARTLIGMSPIEVSLDELNLVLDL